MCLYFFSSDSSNDGVASVIVESDIKEGESSPSTPTFENRENGHVKPMKSVLKRLQNTDFVHSDAGRNETNFDDACVPPKRKRGRPPKACRGNEVLEKRLKLELEKNTEDGKNEVTESTEDKKMFKGGVEKGMRENGHNLIENEKDLSHRLDVKKVSRSLMGKQELELQISEQKKQEMMERARALSLKISQKVLIGKQDVGSCSEAGVKDGAEKVNYSPHSIQNGKGQTSGNGVFKIPRLKKTKSENEILEVKSGVDTVSKVTPPLIKEPIGAKDRPAGWQKMNSKSEKLGDVPSGRKEVKSVPWSASNGRERTSVSQYTAVGSGTPPTLAALTGIITSDKIIPIGSQSSPGADVDKSGTAVNVTNETSLTIASAISPTASCDGTAISSASSMSEVSVEALPTPETVVYAKQKCASQIPSQEIINKITASSKRKSTILIPNAVPAQRERGSAIGIVVAPSPSLKSCLVSAAVNKTEEKGESQLLTTNPGNSSSDMKVSNLEVQSMSASCESSVGGKPVKRKLNLSQYKSILPERRKVLAPSSCESRAVCEVAKSQMEAAGKSALSVTHFYGNCQQVGLDHDYCKREEISEAMKDKAEQLEIDPEREQIGSRCIVVDGRSVEMQCRELADKICNHIKRDTSDRGGFNGVQPPENQIVNTSPGSSSSTNVLAASFSLIKYPEPVMTESLHSRTLNVDDCRAEPAGANVQLEKTASPKASSSSKQCLPGLVPVAEVVSANNQTVTNESCILHDFGLQQNSVCVSTHNELPVSENVLQWRKLKHHAHRHYRGHGLETSVKPVSQASASVSEVSLSSDASSAVVSLEREEVMERTGSLEDGECSPSHVTPATINIMPVYMTSYVPDSKFQCTSDSQNLSSTGQHAFSETNSEVEFLGYGHSSRSPSPVISVGRSSRSSRCSSKKRRLRRKSVSDSSSSRSR